MYIITGFNFQVWKSFPGIVSKDQLLRVNEIILKLPTSIDWESNLIFIYNTYRYYVSISVLLLLNKFNDKNILFECHRCIYEFIEL